MREVRSLRPANVSDIMPATAKPAWGNPQRFLVAGVTVIVLAAIAAIILDRQSPARFPGLRPPEAQREFVKKLSLLHTVLYFRQVILPGIEISEAPGRENARKMVSLGMAALAGVGAIGLILVGVGISGLVRRR